MAVDQEHDAAALNQELYRELRRNEVSEVIDEMSPICRYIVNCG